MTSLLKFAERIDAFNRRVGRIAVWLVLLACLVSAGNAALRYSFNISSNAWLELQWYLFAGTVMLGAPWVLQHNGHVRVDILYTRLSPRQQATLDLAGMIVFLLPVSLFLAWASWPLLATSFNTYEMSGNAGGLIRWPVKALLPAGFALLALQGVAEIIKRIGYLLGVYAMDLHYERPLQ